MIERALESDERLRRILAVTEAELSQLDTDALLTELLERVRDLVDADTAAILLLDRDARQLVTVAALGVEEEILQGFRVDLGVGFAGRVAQTRKPMVIHTVDETTVASPVLRRVGLHTLLAIPMLVEDDLVGVLQVGTFDRRDFSERDLALLQSVADRAALASRSRQSQADRVATLLLQRSLIPGRLPTVDGLQLAARYVPGHRLGVGGDWYDVFRLPSDHLGVVVGDVAGHGIRAAVIMGRMRSALRAYALEYDDPAAVLLRLNRKMRYFEAGSLATVTYAMIGPERDSMVISLAGHPPPVVTAPGAATTTLDLPVNVPIGVASDKPRHNTVVPLPVRSTVVLYTDGVVERRHEVIDVGLRRLCAAVEPGTAEEVCSAIITRMGVATAEDDVALLAIHRTG